MYIVRRRSSYERYILEPTLGKKRCEGEGSAQNGLKDFCNIACDLKQRKCTVKGQSSEI
jgi:hypothetical protein